MPKPDAPTPPRRTFLKKTGLVVVTGMLGTALGTGLAACDSDSGMDDPTDDPGGPTGLAVAGNTLTIDLGVHTALASAGGFLLVRSVGSRSVRAVVVNTDGATFRSYTSVCTHQACDINRFDAGAGELVCPCHGSRFDASDGSVAQGPAQAPIAAFAVSRSGDTLTVGLR